MYLYFSRNETVTFARATCVEAGFLAKLLFEAPWKWAEFNFALIFWLLFHQGKSNNKSRSTYASYYVMNGGSIMRLKEILGHEDLQTTMIYATLSPVNLHEEKNIVAF